MTKEEIIQEIKEIEMVMDCDDSISHYSFTFSLAEERLEELEEMLKELTKE